MNTKIISEVNKEEITALKKEEALTIISNGELELIANNILEKRFFCKQRNCGFDRIKTNMTKKQYRELKKRPRRIKLFTV